MLADGRRMSVRVTVALAGPAMVPPFQPLDKADTPDGTWANLHKVVVEVEAEAILGDIIDMAADRMGVLLDRNFTDSPSVSREIQGIAFDQPGGAYPPTISTMTLVDDEGRAWWGHWWADVAYRDLLRAADAGLVIGDVSRLYLRPTPPAGAIGGPEEWKQLLDGLDLLWEVVQAVGAAHASALAVGAAKRRIRRGIDEVRRHWHQWQKRGGTPHELTLMLTQRDWSTVEIAYLLGCDEPTAQAILELFGLAQDPSTGRWRLEGDQIAALLAGTMQLLLWDRITFGTTTDAAEDRLRELLGERVTHLAERNEAPPEPDYGEIVRRGWEPPT